MAKEQKSEQTAVVSNEQIITLLQKDDKSAVSIISSQIEECRTLAEIENAIGQTSQLDRFAWIKISLLMAKIYESRTKKEASEANKRLQAELGYSKQQMSNFKKAGEKLLSGEYTTLKTGIVKFLNEGQGNESAPVPFSIDKIENRGAYTDSEKQHYVILFVTVAYSDGEKKQKYATISRAQYDAVFLVADTKHDTVTYDEYSENGKKSLIPTFNKWQGDKIESTPLTSFKFISL